MLITVHFVFLHVPRTGGQFVRKTCLNHLPREWLIRNSLRSHTPYEQIVDEFGDLPMLAFVRNPWDWYVSWYHYLTQREQNPENGPMWVTAFDRGRNDFKTTVTNACTGRSFDNPRTAPIMEERGVDHYSALIESIVGSGVEEGRVTIGRYETLADDLEAFLERHGIPVGPAFLHALRAEPPYGASRRDRYQDYYDDELRDLVADGARALIAEHGYSF
jgi:hypothetical protein